MALADLSVLEQRYLAVREVLDTGATVTDVAARHGIDRRTLHRWLVRYANEGMGALAEKSSKPDRCPHQAEADPPGGRATSVAPMANGISDRGLRTDAAHRPGR